MNQKTADLSKFLSVEREILTRVERSKQLETVEERYLDLRFYTSKVLRGIMTLDTAINLFLKYEPINY